MYEFSNVHGIGVEKKVEAAAVLLDIVNSCVKQIPDEVKPKNAEAILNMTLFSNDSVPDMHLNISMEHENGVGGTCAKEKMNTLEKHADICATGQMKKREAELAEDEVSYYGGVRVFFSALKVCEGGVKKRLRGEAKAAYSGAYELVDGWIAVAMIRRLESWLKDEYKDIVWEFNYEPLKKERAMFLVTPEAA